MRLISGVVQLDKWAAEVGSDLASSAVYDGGEMRLCSTTTSTRCCSIKLIGKSWKKIGNKNRLHFQLAKN